MIITNEGPKLIIQSSVCVKCQDINMFHLKATKAYFMTMLYSQCHDTAKTIMLFYALYF